VPLCSLASSCSESARTVRVATTARLSSCMAVRMELDSCFGTGLTWPHSALQIQPHDQDAYELCAFGRLQPEWRPLRLGGCGSQSALRSALLSAYEALKAARSFSMMARLASRPAASSTAATPAASSPFPGHPTASSSPQARPTAP
jgi:hypothetical protein